MQFRELPLSALRAFEAAARLTSFKDAAEELGVTPAALSYQIRNLEDLYGVQLFERRNRTVLLTEAGERLAPGVSSGFSELAAAVEHLTDDEDDHILIISVGPAFASKWLTPRLAGFLEKHPEIDPRISANLGLSDFDRERIDVGIRFGSGDYPGVAVEKLMTEAVTPMCSPELVRNAGGKLAPGDIARHPIIHDDSIAHFDDVPRWSDWLTQMGVDGVDLDRGLHFNHAEHALDAAIEGAGIVLGREVLAARDLRQGRLVRPFDLTLSLPQAFYLAYRPGALDKPNIRALRDWLVEEIKADNVCCTKALA